MMEGLREIWSTSQMERYQNADDLTKKIILLGGDFARRNPLRIRKKQDMLVKEYLCEVDDLRQEALGLPGLLEPPEKRSWETTMRLAAQWDESSHTRMVR